MAVQTTYSIEHAIAYAGMLADEQIFNSVSKLNADTVTIPYGKGVVTSGEDGAVLPSSGSTAAQFVGVAMRELNRAYVDGATFGAPIDRDFTVVTHGVIWVKVLDTVAKDAAVYLRVGSTNPGDFSGVVGTGATLGVAITGAKFLTGGDAGELVKISLGIGG